MYRGLIFDLDGTVFWIKKYIPIFRGFQSQIIGEMTGVAPELTPDEGYTSIRLPKDKSNEYLRTRFKIDDPERYWKRLEELDHQGRKDNINLMKPYPDVVALNSLAKHFKMGMLSNAPQTIVDFLIEHYNLGEIFPHRLGVSYNTELSKPETGGLDILLEMMELTREDVAFIGDTQTDRELCENAGIPFIQRRNDNAPYALPDKTETEIGDFHQLRGVLNELQMR